MNNSNAIHVEGYIGNIFNVSGDAIVNSANWEPSYPKNSSLDAQIYKKAGPSLIKERRKHGYLKTGDILVTDSYELKKKYGYSYIIHINLPNYNYQQSKSSFNLGSLCKCYYDIFNCAIKNEIQTIVIPLLGVGYKRFPVEWSLKCFDMAATMVNKEYETPNLLTVRLVLSTQGNALNPPAYDMLIQFQRLNLVYTLPILAYIDYKVVKGSEYNSLSFNSSKPMKRQERLARMERDFVDNTTLSDDTEFRYTPDNIDKVSETFMSLISPFHKKLLECAHSISVKDACDIMHITTGKFYNIVKKKEYDRDTVIEFAMAFDIVLDQCNELLESANFAVLDPSVPRDKEIISLYEKNDYDKLYAYLSKTPTCK